MQIQIQELQSTISHLRDQNLVLRAAQANIGNGKETVSSSANNHADIEKELQMYKTRVIELEKRLEHTRTIQEHKEKDNEKNETGLEYQLQLKIKELEKLKKDHEDLLELLTDQDSKITLYKERLTELGDKVNTSRQIICIIRRITQIK